MVVVYVCDIDVGQGVLIGTFTGTFLNRIYSIWRQLESTSHSWRHFISSDREVGLGKAYTKPDSCYKLVSERGKRRHGERCPRPAEKVCVFLVFA